MISVSFFYSDQLKVSKRVPGEKPIENQTDFFDIIFWYHQLAQTGVESGLNFLFHVFRFNAQYLAINVHQAGKGCFLVYD